MSFRRAPRRQTPTRTRPPSPAPQRRSPPYPADTPPTMPGIPAPQPYPDNPRWPGPTQPVRGPAAPGAPEHGPGYPGGYPGSSYPPAAPPPVYHPVPPPSRRRQKPPRRRPRLRGCCILPLLLGLLLLVPLWLYLFAPVRTNFLIMGIDYVEPGSALARSDTIMLASIQPSSGYVGLVSVPRDLWVTIPNVGENRINTAHFYAEGVRPGSGPEALLHTIAVNFNLHMRYFVRIRFESVRDMVDALGGVDIELTESMAGYPPGRHHLTGRKALAFVRDRANSDDFFRMDQGQFMVRALFKNLLNPLKWPRIPAVSRVFFGSVQTNIPVSLWPRLAVTLLRAGPGGIDSRIINREMVTPMTTTDGAMVLAPNWPAINALIAEVFY